MMMRVAIRRPGTRERVTVHCLLRAHKPPRAQNQRKTHWREDQVIEIADDTERYRLRVPWHTGIARRQVERLGVSLEAARQTPPRL